ncbi:hypothetical protein P775_28275 [Puniceibacterium antarcticum]|uniref:Lysozyme n=1 Tax=Puniceibacterium antarcticum TaxID=1206336 RepID=A0A2G8QT05_9RHOB|nr:hypothetical protein [Puniceibacterium antarcticum]PIL12404.1 hypothetical protein P775_28275 [Puniceibacterium antarcticum]
MICKRYALAMTMMGSLWLPTSALADSATLFGGSGFLQNRRAFIPQTARADPQEVPRRVASLFAGQEGSSLFAPWPQRYLASDSPFAWGPNATAAERIRHLIGYAEAGSLGYDAVQYGAVQKPAKRPTNMTLIEIYRWIADTPGQPHAIGRYQFIPETLKRVVAKTGTDVGQFFSPQLQDQLADVLLVEAGLNDFHAGQIGQQAFMNNLAKIWAGLPTSSGRSHYDGFAGNRATMTWDRFDKEIASIFPG